MTSRSRSSGLLRASLIGLSLTGLVGLGSGCSSQRPPETPPVTTPRKISALGRVEPETKIRKVAVSSSLSGDRIQDILVEENQVVRKGQPLAILNSYGTLKAALEEAEGNVAVARSQLAQVKAGAKQGEIQAQEYKVESLKNRLAGEKLSQDQNVKTKEARLKEAQVEARRYGELFSKGAVSELQRDRYVTRAETAQSELAQAIETRAGTLNTLRSEIASAQQTLDKIKEIRPVDITAAESELRKAIAARDKARQEFSYATVTAPQDGRILKLVARPGDKIGDDGLLEMADTSRMIVTAEVYQTDMPGIFKGQKAIISADGFKGSVPATVYQINAQVQRQSIFAGEPGENMDQRVFEVKLRLDPNDPRHKRIEFASNLQVNVLFEPKANGTTP